MVKNFYNFINIKHRWVNICAQFYVGARFPNKYPIYTYIYVYFGFRHDLLSCVHIEHKLRYTIISAWRADSYFFFPFFYYFQSVGAQSVSAKCRKFLLSFNSDRKVSTCSELKIRSERLHDRKLRRPDRMPKRTQPFYDLRGDPCGVWSRQFRTRVD